MDTESFHYALAPMKGFIDYAEALLRLYQLSTRAINIVRATPPMMEVIAAAGRKHASWNEQEFADGMALLLIEAEAARKECDAGFPIFHEFLIVGMWGAFEATLDDLIVSILSHEKERLLAEPLSKIKIPLAEFETLEPEDRMRLLVKEWKRSLHVDHKIGIGAFESRLKLVDLSGEVEPEIREGIWEMAHARNVIVHRRSRVDRAFVAACPKRGLRVGDRVSIDSALSTRYTQCLAEYGTRIIRRIQDRYVAIIKGNTKLLTSQIPVRIDGEQL